MLSAVLTWWPIGVIVMFWCFAMRDLRRARALHREAHERVFDALANLTVEGECPRCAMHAMALRCECCGLTFVHGDNGSDGGV